MSAAISPPEIEAELKKILDSSLFRRAERSSRFLEYVVRKTLAGSASSLNEYAIGLEAFRLGSDKYDPLADPKVRVEAGRLRARLAEYYQELGRHDPIRIHLPKGSYVPIFSRNGVESPGEGTTPDSALPAAGPDEKVIARAGDRHWRRWLGVAAVVILAIVVVTYSVSRPSARFTGKDSIVLGDFENKTGDAVFDDTLRQGLAIQIGNRPSSTCWFPTESLAQL